MKKYDMRSRMGRARRRSSEQFNPHTLLPHTPGSFQAERNRYRRSEKAAEGRLRWNAILGAGRAEVTA